MAYATFILPLLTSWVPSHVSGQTIDPSKMSLLETRLAHARAEENRWQGVIRTEQLLSSDPNRFSKAAEDVGRDLKSSGVELIFDGVSGGLSNFLDIQAVYTKADPGVSKQFKIAAAALKTAYTDFVKDRIRSVPLDEATLTQQVNSKIEKVNATLSLIAVTSITSSNVRSALSATMDLNRGALQLIQACARSDRKSIETFLPMTEAMLSGTSAMLRAYAAGGSPEALVGLAQVLTERYPAFGAMAGLMASTALTDVRIAIALANVAWGGFAMANGISLISEAELIRSNQQTAVERLRQLLPRARVELERARQEQRRILAAIDIASRQPALPIAVRPSQRFIDEASEAPLGGGNLIDVMATLRANPNLAYGITMEERRRRAQEEARRRTEEVWNWIKSLIPKDNRPYGSGGSGGSTESSGSDRGGIDFTPMRDTIRSIPNVRFE